MIIGSRESELKQVPMLRRRLIVPSGVCIGPATKGEEFFSKLETIERVFIQHPIG